MTEDDKKRLSEFLGECYPEWPVDSMLHHSPFPVHGWASCLKCGVTSENHREGNRTFTTPQDMVDLKDKLVENGMWDEFYSNLHISFSNSRQFHQAEDFGSWLLNPERFCGLVNDFLKEEGHE
jgi:hypothetical protein